MAENYSDFKENVKNAFSKVKEEIKEIKESSKENNKLLFELTRRLTVLEENNNDLNYKGIKEAQRLPISSGNQGVLSNKQQQATTSNNTLSISNQTFDELKGILKRLTDREISVFMTIYELEEELGFGKVSYKDIAERLKLSESAIRAYIMYLTNKGMPIGKGKLLNGKSQFFIKKWFRDLNLPIILLKPVNSKKT
ncbi:response regulator transcription factor [Candidatus Woesearchaeota archaeon]|nr:response regulator transcription factor [Candidatus Woesearchaeota archaeon]